MDDDRKFEISSAVGTTVFFISCIGIGSYEEAVHEGYESIHEKLPMETVFTSSLVTGIVLAIITWLIVTFWDCLKRAKEKDELTTWGLFKKEVFSKNTLLAINYSDCRFSSNCFSWNIVYRLGYFLITSIERKI